MGALIGLAWAVGLLLLGAGAGRPGAHAVATTRRRRDRVAALTAQAGMPSVTPRRLMAASGATGLATLVLVAAASRSAAVGLALGAFGAYAPWALLRSRARRRVLDRREIWPDVVDNLASAVRAGLSLPEALAQLADRGPREIRDPLRRFARDYRATGRFGECLDRLKAELADPVADRIVEALRLAREVGGSDLGRLLRGLSQFLREDARTRAEIETRQGWTVNAARLALAAPWVVLALLALRPETVAAYDSPTGVAVLVVGGGVSVAAYRVMVRIGRLPEDERVLR